MLGNNPSSFLSNQATYPETLDVMINNCIHSIDFMSGNPSKFDESFKKNNLDLKFIAPEIIKSRQLFFITGLKIHEANLVTHFFHLQKNFFQTMLDVLIAIKNAQPVDKEKYDRIMENPQLREIPFIRNWGEFTDESTPFSARKSP